MKPTVLSLCDESGVMVQPWADAGYGCVCVDLLRRDGTVGPVVHVQADVRDYMPDFDPHIIFAFPPCTHTAVSGARWFKAKGPAAAAEAFSVLAGCLRIIESFDCPWMVENPVSTFSTYWRKPDLVVHPWQFGDGYDKATCLWTGGGFIAPEPTVTERPADTDQRIHRMPPGPDRQRLRSQTPAGFARAVFAANAGRLVPCPA